VDHCIIVLLVTEKGSKKMYGELFKVRSSQSVLGKETCLPAHAVAPPRMCEGMFPWSPAREGESIISRVSTVLKRKCIKTLK